MTRGTTGLSPVEATESWFIHHGLPYFVPEERACAREALSPRRILPVGVGVGVAAVAAAVALSWLLGDLSLGAAGLTLIGVLAAGLYAVTALRGRPILSWAFTRTMGSLHLLLPMVTRALPLLLLFVTFLFINAEVWQLAASLDGGVLWLTVLMFGVMALVFLLTRLPEELDGTGGQVEAEQLRRTCRGTPLEGELESLIERGHVGVLDADDIRVRGYERANLLLVMVIVQAVQVLVLAAAVFSFFMVFGAIVMSDEVMQTWLPNGTHHLSWLPNVSVELVQVSIFLAAFSGLYFTVVVLTDETYREQFFTGVKAELDRAVGVRVAYLALRARRQDEPAPPTLPVAPMDHLR
ncbi:MAG: hypothetical protein JWQ15_1729 [Marmoricola sp.]|nr:hypothetical protein [Marmoricola sp.]